MPEDKNCPMQYFAPPGSILVRIRPQAFAKGENFALGDLPRRENYRGEILSNLDVVCLAANRLLYYSTGDIKKTATRFVKKSGIRIIYGF
jgi:hypothetical protein